MFADVVWGLRLQDPTQTVAGHAHVGRQLCGGLGIALANAHDVVRPVVVGHECVHCQRERYLRGDLLLDDERLVRTRCVDVMDDVVEPVRSG